MRRAPSIIGRAVARLPLFATGWRFEGPLPDDRKYVCIAAPHTSNWDGALLLALARSIGLPMAWMIKSEWLGGAKGVLLRRLGAIGIDRTTSHNVVEQMIEQLRRADELVLVIPPEGTRRRAEHWKSGFYHIARGADVPVVPGYLDYARKRAGFGPAMRLTGDVRADMDVIRGFYEKVRAQGRVPDQFGPIRLREEDGPAPG